MSDRSALTVNFPGDLPAHVRNAIAGVMGHEDITDQYLQRDLALGELMDEEVALGTDEEVFSGILDIIANGVEDHDTGDMIPVQDFPFKTLQDPKYEYNGVLRKHTPGLPDFAASADASGQVILPTAKIMEYIEAAESLDSLKATLAAALGTNHAL